MTASGIIFMCMIIMFNFQTFFIKHNTSKISNEAIVKVLHPSKLFLQDAYENCSATSGNMSSIFHASHEVHLTLLTIM
jgi:hypothetical protein